MTVVELVGITKRFPGVVANDGISLAFEAGEIHAILGENGAGKSTLMSILSGLTHPDSGEIIVDGKTVRFNAPVDAIACGIGMIYQHFMLVDAFTVMENFLVGVRSGGKQRRVELKREIETLSKRYGLQVNPEARVSDLSVGEKQRVEILRMLHRGAKVFILDEPTSVLTPQEVDQLGTTLRHLAREGKAIIFITHKLAEVVKFADCVTVLRSGKVAATLEKTQISLEKLAGLMVGDEQVLSQRYLSSSPGEEILRLEYADVTLSLRAGEILGVAGVAGNGQRELAEAIAGLRPLTAGKLSFRGVETRERGYGQNGRVRFIPEDRIGTGLAPTMSVEHNLVLRQYSHPPITWGILLRQAKLREIAAKLIADFRIKAPRPNMPIEYLSGGNRQKVIVARETAENPEILIAANPTQGLDLATTAMVHQKLEEMRNAGVAILLISEDLDELLAIADRIAVLHGGNIVDIVDPRTTRREDIGLLMSGVNGGKR